MESVIFYFSGTGNSLSVARDIAGKLGNTRLIPISDALKNSTFDPANKKIDLSSRTITVVFLQS